MNASHKAFVTLRIEGSTGDGVISMGMILAKVAARMGGHVYAVRTYPAEVRGGQSTFQLRIGPRPVHSQGSTVDVLVAMNETALRNNRTDLDRSGGALIHGDSADKWDGARECGAVRYAVDYDQIVREARTFPRSSITSLCNSTATSVGTSEDCRMKR